MKIKTLPRPDIAANLKLFLMINEIESLQAMQKFLPLSAI